MSYFTWTGNPWVDAGVSAIIVWNNKKRPEDINIKDIEKISEEILKLYTTKSWLNNMQSIFPNGALTNPAYSKSRKSTYKKVLNALIENIEDLQSGGSCIACGRRNYVKLSKKYKGIPNSLLMTKTYLPLTGSGTLLNFFSFAEEGNDVCYNCSFAIQCSPLVMYRCGNLVLLHSNSLRVLILWAKHCVDRVRRQLATKNYIGCIDDEYKNPINALFYLTTFIIREYQENWENEKVSIRLYHFTNYNQGPDLKVYDLPAPIFSFISKVKVGGYTDNWYNIIRKGYGKIENKSEDNYKNYNNDVYIRLLNNNSIIRYFIDRSHKRATGNWNLLSLYLKEVRKMDQNRIDTIRKIADEIVEVIKKSPNGKKRLSGLERADNYSWYRNVLFRIVKDRIVMGKDEPMFTFDEYVERLFPDGALGWRETQDLILFRIYEKLHTWLLQQGIVKEESEEEKVEEESEQA